MVVQLQIRHDTAANWTAANPVLASGEMGYETDTKKRKTGDGTTAWNSLAYEMNEIPTASDTVLGGIKVGNRLTITAGVLSADPVGIMTPSVRGGARLGSGLQITDTDLLSVVPYSLPIAAADVLGGIKVGSNLSINGSGVLSAVVPDPTGLTGTTSSTFQLDNDASGPTLSHIYENTAHRLEINSAFVANDSVGVKQTGRDNRKCIDDLVTIATNNPDPSDVFYTDVVGSAVVNGLSWTANPWGSPTGALVANITVTTAGATVNIRCQGRNLADLTRVVAWYRINATPSSTTFSCITESYRHEQRNTFGQTIPSGNSNQMLDDESVVTETGSFTSEEIIFRFANLPVGTYNIQVISCQFQGYNVLSLYHGYGNPGVLQLLWASSETTPAMAIGDGIVPAGYYERSRNSDDEEYFGRYMIAKLWDSNRVNFRDFTIIDAPVISLPGSTYYEEDKVQFLDMNLLVNGSKGIMLGNMYDGRITPPMKYPISNMFSADLTGWTATAGDNTTVNSSTWVEDESPSGSGAMNVNVTVAAGQTGTLTIQFDGAHRLMYPTRGEVAFKKASGNGMQGINVAMITLSEWNSERWYIGNAASTSTSLGWRSAEYQFLNPVYDSNEEYMDWTGEQVQLILTNLPEGTYDIRMSPVFIYGESYPMIRNECSFDHPLSVNITSNEDTPVHFLVEGNMVLVFRGSSATAPDAPETGHCYIDTSGTPVFKIWDGTAWV